MNWIKRALSEPNGAPSSQRCFLLILLVFTLNLLACSFAVEGKLPDIPASLADLLKWLFGFVVSGISLGKISNAIVAAKTESAPDA